MSIPGSISGFQKVDWAGKLLGLSGSGKTKVVPTGSNPGPDAV